MRLLSDSIRSGDGVTMGSYVPDRRIQRGRWSFAVAIALAALLGIACGSDGSPTGGRLQVVTSLELFADMARQVGGDTIDVTAILPSGSDPHTFEPSPGRVADIARADIVFVNGLGLEGNLRDVIDENAGGPVVALAEERGDIAGNPHLWLDAGLAAGYVTTIRDALIAQDPGRTDAYTANAGAYLAVLAELDADFASAIDALPPERRKLVTFHDAYPYLARRYGLEIVAVVVRSPGQEPNAQDVAELIDAIEAQEVPAVFKEPQFNATVLELAADEAGVQVFDLLSDAYTDGVASYVGLMEFNMAQLVEGLGGN